VCSSDLGHSGYSGYSSISGYSGYSGPSGYSGYSGPSGYSGYSGISGYSGYSGSGISGYSGYSGHSGYSGYSGRSGYSGYSSLSGYSGYSGPSGYSGYSGTKYKYFTSSDGVSTSTSVTMASKLLATFTPDRAGNHMIFWSCEVSSNSATGSRYVGTQVLLDTATTIAGENRINVHNAGDYYPLCGLYQANLTLASHTVDIQFNIGNALSTASIRNARIHIQEV
jgi:hypothetical protein